MHTATIKPIDQQFNPDNLQIAFRTKTNSELKLAHFLFKLMESPALVKAGGLAARAALALKLPVKGLIKRTIYRHFCGGTTVNEAQTVMHRLNKANVHTVLDYAAEAQETETGFDKVKDEVFRNISIAVKTGSFSYLSIKLTGIGPKEVFRKLHENETLTTTEQQAFNRTKRRLDAICQAVAEAGLTLYIDAEESWMQDPMDELAEKMMLRYNLGRAAIFNTLQMYRVDRVSYLEACLKRFETEQAIAGIKIVRGAYLEKEQLRAQDKGYPCPVFTAKQDTDNSFNKAIDICLDNLNRVELCAATHNEASTLYLVNRIQEEKVKPYKERVHFSQLFGMSDNLTFNLAYSGFNVSKYLPYGDVATTIPYLLRRAEENTSIAGQMGRELSLLKQEMKRRQL